MLIVVGPLLALSHLIVDAPGTELTWWTGTIASYDVAVIIVIIGTALAFIWKTNGLDAMSHDTEPPLGRAGGG